MKFVSNRHLSDVSDPWVSHCKAFSYFDLAFHVSFSSVKSLQYNIVECEEASTQAQALHKILDARKYVIENPII